MLDDLQQVLPLLLLFLTVSSNLVVIFVHHTEGPLTRVVDNCHIGHNTFILGILCDISPHLARQVVESHEPLSGLDTTELEEQPGLLSDEAADGRRAVLAPANGGELWLAGLELLVHLSLCEGPGPSMREELKCSRQMFFRS